jgi:hypothetical protein
LKVGRGRGEKREEVGLVGFRAGRREAGEKKEKVEEL